MIPLAIDAQNLVKRYPRRSTTNGSDGKPRRLLRLPFRKREIEYFTAVDGVSLQVEKGEIFGLLGPNGAGKTTTIRMLCTLLEPSSGRALVNGYDIQAQANRVRQSLGTVLAGERSIYWKLTARENLEYFAALFHIPPKVARRRIAELLERMELTARADELVEKYSTGMKQRVAISKALLADPPILLLDEPTLGLDPQAARKVRELVAELKEEGRTILLTTHYMEEADQLSDRIGIIDQGKIIALDTSDALKERIGQKDIIRMEVADWQPEIAEGISAITGIENLVARQMDGAPLWEVSIQTESSRDVLPTLLGLVNFNGTHLVNMNILKPSLEDVFIQMTGKALRD